MFFILKLIINMELIDTPNPNAKKVLAKNKENAKITLGDKKGITKYSDDDIFRDASLVKKP